MLKRKPLTPENALLQMADLCARSEQCSFDILEKLKKKGLPLSECRKVVEKLKEMKYIDDSRFAGAYARDKASFHGWGKRKIRYALVLKKIDSATISEALDSIDEKVYKDVIERLVKSKAQKYDPRVYEERAKILRSLAMKGYEPTLISKAISEYVAAD